MTTTISTRSLLMLGAAAMPLSPLAAQAVPDQTPPATTQPAAPAAAQSVQRATTEPAEVDPTGDYGDEEIVITGSRARGSVVGDIPPESTLDSRDVRATGATNISELLDALAPQLGSSQGRSGGRPVMLLDGKRISGFRELRDIPTEAIERVDILPEEVGLKYGYGADQKVVNIVLRQRFHSTAVTLGGGAATAGGYASANADGTRLTINRGGRTTLNLHAEGNSLLTENERNIDVDAPEGTNVTDVLAARSLVGSKRMVRGSGTVNRTIFGDVSATVNGELEHDQGRSLIGLGDTLLLPLARRTDSDSAHLGFALNGSKDKWQWSVTGNGDLDRSRTRTDIDDPANLLDRARETTTSGDITATANGSLFKLPAGDASTTLTVAGSTVHLNSEGDSTGETGRASLGRTAGQAAINLDLPISRRNRGFSALGNLTLNANAEVNQLSDFGTLTKLGAGANFSPVDRLNLLASWSREEGPPTINQLGDPVLETQGARIFDFTRNETVLATAITGGNPDLQADRRTVMKLGGNWQPFSKVQLRLRADYVHSRIDNPIQGIFGPTSTLEAAFPDRFQRDSSGQLISVDLRPINFDEARRDTLRVGLDFSKPLKSKRPSQSVMDQMRAQFRRDRGTPAPAAAPAAPADGSAPAPQAAPTTGEAPPPPPLDSAGTPAGAPPAGQDSGRGFRGGGRGDGGGFFGGGSRGRLQFSLADTITFVDKVSIGPGLPVLDYLHGEAAGGSGGTPRHKVEAQAGWSNNGYGARLSANWQSGTTVNSMSGDDLHFSSLATFDLRLFANFSDRPELTLKHPWLRGASLRFSVDNIFDSKPRVHDAAGMVPNNYQPDLLNPLGRTVMISFRKLFSPSPASFMRQRERDQARSNGS